MPDSSSAPARPPRLAAIDWLRGFVMMLMAVDHASAMFNPGRLAADSIYAVGAFGAGAWEPGSPLAPAQFWTRWITHLCAPTFLFLSGTSLAMSVAGRQRRGAGAVEIDRHLVARGLVLLVFEALWISLGPSAAAGRYVLVLQVLYAIGVSLIAMAGLRRLPTAWLVGLPLAWFAAGEWITFALAAPGETAGPLAVLLLAPGRVGIAFVAYPLLSWLAMMMLGWAFGQHLLAQREAGKGTARIAAQCAWAGLAALALFAVLRGLDGYGNLGLHRDGAGLVQWLHVAKYPPAASFAALELGLMGLLLAALLGYEARRAEAPHPLNPFLVLGRTALFFYVLHFAVLAVGAAATGLMGRGALWQTWAAAAAAVVLLYPACLAYGRYKARHPGGWTQYL